jgi:hypothetical protein
MQPRCPNRRNMTVVSSLRSFERFAESGCQVSLAVSHRFKVDLGDLLLILLTIFALAVASGALILRAVGFSFGKGALITTTFLFLGFWNPVGWVVLGLCIWLQVRENRERLQASRMAAQVAPAGSTRVEVGPATSAPGSRRPMLRRGDRC